MKTAAEGLKRLVETKKVSRNVNYEAMNNLFKWSVCWRLSSGVFVGDIQMKCLLQTEDSACRVHLRAPFWKGAWNCLL